MMKAVQFTYSYINTARTVSTARPMVLVEGEVLIKVKYSALDTALDDVINKTFAGGFIHKQTNPLFLGWHFSGAVEKTGNLSNKEHQFRVGDAVFGHLQYAPDMEQGSLSEYIVVKADACALKPKQIPWDLAAACTTEVLTALQALRDEGGLKDNNISKEQHCILINGAGGQVGGSAVQIAKCMGAHVTAVCSTKDVDRISKLGADVVIDRKKTQNVYSLFKRDQFDIIFDTPNALSSAKALKFLKPKGNFVSTLPNWTLLWGMICSMFSSKNVKMVSVKSIKSDLELVGRWLQDGFEVDIDSDFPVKDIVKAMIRNRDPTKKGRVVLQVENGW